MTEIYKLIPPPHTAADQSKECNQTNEPEKKEIDINDNYMIALKNIFDLFNEKQYEPIFNEILNFCRYLEDKKIPEEIPYLCQFHTIDIIINLCSDPLIRQNIQALEIIFHLMHILTQESSFCFAIPIDLLASFLNLDLIYQYSNWYFKLLSNYVLQPNTFKPINIIDILPHIQKVNNEKQILKILSFLEILSKFKFLGENTNFKPYEISDLSQAITLITGYCASSIEKKRRRDNSIIRSATVIFERLTRKHLLPLELFESLKIDCIFMNICDFGYSNYYPKLIKFIGYFIYYYKKIPFELEFSVLADTIFNGSDLNQYKYNLWTLYNSIKVDNSALIKSDTDTFSTVDTICNYLYNGMDSMDFLIKKQAVLLLALIYSCFPLEKLRNEANLETALQLFLQFSEDPEDNDMIENIFDALIHIHKFLCTKPQLKSESLIPLFYECKESLTQIYLNLDPNRYQLLQNM